MKKRILVITGISLGILITLVWRLQIAHGQGDSLASTNFPVAWWTFDEGEGTITSDGSSNGHSGTLLGDPPPIWTSGIGSNALVFDGVQNSVSVANASDLTPTGGLTLAAWVKAQTTTTGIIFDKWSADGLSGSYSLGLTNGHVGLELSLNGTDFSVIAPPAIHDTNWHYVAGSYDGSQMVVYLDGKIRARAAASGSVDVVAAPLLLGNVAGAIDDVRIYNGALSSNDVAALYFAGATGPFTGSGAMMGMSTAMSEFSEDSFVSDLIGWWQFNDGSGTNALDSSGYDQTGVLSGDPTPPSWTNGVVGGALDFNRDNQNFVATPSTAFSQLTTQLTVAAWVKTQDADGWVLAKWGQCDDDYEAEIGGFALEIDSPTNAYFWLFSFDDWWVNSATAIVPTNTWTHLAGVYDGSTIRLYENGVAVGSPVAFTAPVNLCDSPFGMGADLVYGSYFTGQLGDVSVYSVALSADEIAALYNTDTIGDGIPDWWRLQHFGSGTTTNSSSCASCDPDGDGLTNLQEYQAGTDPFVANVLTVPPMVRTYSTDNPASVTDLGGGASYWWSIDNGTITAGDGTPNVAWSAGDAGAATLSVAVRAAGAGGTATVTASSSVMACILEAVILTPPEVRAGSTNTASLPSPLTTVKVISAGLNKGITQGSGADSNFYGSAGTSSGDIVFRISPQGVYSNLFSFDTNNLTRGYTTSVPVEGNNSSNLYGVTAWGGKTNDFRACLFSDSFGFGTVYKSTQQGALTNLHIFTGAPTDGALPLGALVQGTGGDTNSFYGVTEAGGTNVCTLPWGCCILGYGTVFKVDANSTNNYQTVHKFNGGTDGAYPEAGLFLSSDGFLYGTTYFGGTNSATGTTLPGTNGFGNVFKVKTDGSSFKVLHQFGGTNTDGAAPSAPVLQASDGFIYGTTTKGGTNGLGTIFKVSTNGDVAYFQTLHQFSGGAEGLYPNAGLVQSYDTNLYGTTWFGGRFNNGTIFRLSAPAFTNYTTLHEFIGTWDGTAPNFSGTVPAFSLNKFDGYLYGVTIGNLFKYLPATYTWIVTNGTIVAGQGTPNLTWAAGSSGTVTITVIVSDSPVCVTTNFTTVISYKGAISAGGAHSLALTADGSLWSWGINGDGSYYGDLGDGTTVNRPFPVEVADVTSCGGQTISNVVTMAGDGDECTVVADANGTVWTCGENEHGQLGNGSDSLYQLVPTPIGGVSNVVSVAAGDGHTLTLRWDGTVFAWGEDASGQLGIGPASGSTNSTTPVQSQIPAQTAIVAIAAGANHSVALDRNGKVWTWGLGNTGQLGYGGTGNTNLPIQVAGISNVVAIAAGFDHTMALTADKRVWTWGGNVSGQLGDGSQVNQLTPELLTTMPTNVVAIAGGSLFSLAVTSNGQVYAWGDNSFGQLGTNTNGGILTSPHLVAGISNAVLVSAHSSGEHSLAMTVDHGTNRYWGWGLNYSGQVGNGTNSYDPATSTYNQYTPASAQFCTRCQRCVQLGTNGSFTAQCTGTLVLYFNDAQGVYNDNSGSFAVTVDGFGATNVPASDPSGYSTGVAIGTVIKGSNYTYSASGLCSHDPQLPATDANGNPTNGMVSCSSINRTNAICPAATCFSLVGKIQ